MSYPDRHEQVALRDLVAHARRHSRYYAIALAGVAERGWRLEDLPLLDPVRYWHLESDIGSWVALTAPIGDAYVFRSGGSSGPAKWSVCTRAEWERLCRVYGAAIATRLQARDRIANLFFAGNLYASHLFIHTALSHVRLPVSEFPFAGSTPLDMLARTLAEQRITVLAVVPAHLMQLAACLDAQGQSLPAVRAILYGGDSLFADQQPLLARVFPHAVCASIGYASVDVGVLGASLPDCGPGEHRVFDGETILEILDEDSGAPIEAPGQAGMLVATSLTRQLTPLIRCPTGDRAAWCEPPGPARRFVLAGRSASSRQVRIGTVFVLPDVIGDCLSRAVPGLAGWQVVLSRRHGVDHVLVRIAADTGLDQQATDALLSMLLTAQPGMAEMQADGLVELAITWCATAMLELDPRT